MANIHGVATGYGANDMEVRGVMYVNEVSV
jgi:hypothetical protein